MKTAARQCWFRNGFGQLLLFSLGAIAIANAASWDSSFRRPPDAVRPWVYWMWMDGNISRAGITGDLEAMQKAGIGGVLIMEVNAGIPRGPVNFMSPDWRALFKHAVAEATRLGLQLTINAGPGWTGSGGPWVKPEQSMQHLVTSALETTGPKRFSDLLPRPQRRPAFFGDGALPPALEQAKNEFYRDVAVLAFPTPANSPTIANIDEKALYVRAPYSSQPKVKPYLPMPAVYPALPSTAVIATNQMVELTDRLSADGRLDWEVPAGRWTILRLGRTSTGANTRPAPEPGLGLECDKLDAKALEAHFDAFVGALLREIGPRSKSRARGWVSLHIDSWEMGAQNWTADFRALFKQRRGYDCLRYLPTLSGRVVESLETSERFLWDLRQTVQELIVENHAQHLKDLGRRQGLGLSIEPYDMTPCADMNLGAVADVPMGEFWANCFDTFYSCIEAVSIAHTQGRKIVGAEAFTSDDRERWQFHPGTLKALGDWAFCAGINRVVFHRYQHQPWLDRAPGMTMGPYGVHWERTQTWWGLVPAFHTYQSRCQFLLRQGLPVADICYLVGEGAPQVFRPPASATRAQPPDRLGYNFDGCTANTLMTRASVRDGRLTLPDGMSYQVLVLPERDTMTPQLVAKIRNLAVSGLTVIGPRPLRSPSLSGYPQCDGEVSRLATELWGLPSDARSTSGGQIISSQGFAFREHPLGRGKMVFASGDPAPTNKTPRDSDSLPEQYGDYGLTAAVLARNGVAPDFTSDAPLRYVHRREGSRDCYFVANPETRAVVANCGFRVRDRQPELWNPLNGEVRQLPRFTFEDGRTWVPLRFEPHQSWFVVFRRSPKSSQPAQPNFSEPQFLAPVSGPWTVSFEPKWGGPAHVVFEELVDWTKRPEPGIKYYSGVAIYRTQFNRPANLSPGMAVELDLGEVRELAQVRLNGIDLGVVWCAPWRVEISRALRDTNNQLEISVANLWPNRLIGDEHFPADCEYRTDGSLAHWPEWLLKNQPRPSQQRVTFTTWRFFEPTSPLLPSGLLGPVRLCRIPDIISAFRSN
jgi:hypothetical protein